VLEDLVHAADGAGATDLSLRVRLELSLRQPDRARDLISRAGRTLDEGVAHSQGHWLLEHWLPRMRVLEAPDTAAGEALLLAGRVALHLEDDAGALGLFTEAADAAPSHVESMAERLLGDAAPPPRLQRDDAYSHEVRARAFEALTAHDLAINEVDAALEATPEDDLERQIELLELKATALQRGGRRSAAATAYVELGRRFDLRTEHTRAVEAYANATRNDDRNAEAFWYLADSRRLATPRGPSGKPDPAAVRQAHDDWEAGLRIRPPTPAEAWVYWSGALLHEALADTLEDGEPLLWRAALLGEQSFALDDSLAGACAVIGRCHRMLSNPATSVVAIDRAASVAPEDVGVVTERVLTLCEIASSSAEEAIDRYEAVVAPDAWAAGMRGYALLYAGSHEEALAAFEPAVTEDSDDYWAIMHCALTRALLGDLDGARADALRVLAATEPQGNRLADEDAGIRAWCALLSGMPDDAAEAFERARDSVRADPVDTHVGLACVALLAGDHERAKALTEAAAIHATYRRQTASITLGLELAERLGAPDAGQALPSSFEELERRIASRRFDVGEALEEVATAPDRAPVEAVRRTAAGAARARMLAQRGNLLEAAEAYESLLEPAEGRAAFTPARERMLAALQEATADAIRAGDVAAADEAQRRAVSLGVSTEGIRAAAVAMAHHTAGQVDEALEVLDRLTREQAALSPEDALFARRLRGDMLVARERVSEALDAYRAALSADGRASHRDQAAVATRIGVAEAAVGDLGAGLKQLRTAFELVRADEGRTTAAEFVFDACTEIRELPLDPPLLPMSLRALTDDSELTPGERRRLTSARFNRLRAARESGDGAPAALHPIVLEAHEIFFADGAETPGVPELIGEAIPRMRTQLARETGVTLPGILIRSSLAVGRDEIKVHIQGVPYRGGRILDGATLCPDARACRDVGLDGAPADNAWLGPGAGIWLDEEVADAVAWVPLLRTYDSMLWFLEGIVRCRLAGFVGLDEIYHRLDEWKLEGDPDRQEHVEQVISGHEDRSRLAALARALVRQQVPIRDVGALVDALAATGTERGWLGRAAEEARARLRSELPGIRDDRDLVAVGDQAETAVAAVRGTVADISQEEAKDILAESLHAVDWAAPARFALVVNDSSLRPAVQALADRLAPSAAVLSAVELESEPYAAQMDAAVT
jgi:tetratricopeptide (TPR) repeat protein